jgi:tRNA threonylcarbamoyladenosine biosynthesis protein TsaB
VIAVAVDTATDRLSVAAGEPGGGWVAAGLVEGARRHTGQLAALVEKTLGELGRGLEDVGAVALSDGPGSFTGLRVAAAWAKGLLRARPMPLWVASTLLVRVWPHARPGDVALGVGTALRGEVYVAGYRFGVDRVVTVLPPQVLAPGASPPIDPDVVVSDHDGPRSWSRAPRVVVPPEGLPVASALLAMIGVSGGAVQVAEPSSWEPWYGRPAEAQAKWERAHGKPLRDSSRVGR